MSRNSYKPTNTVIGSGFTIQAACLTGTEAIRIDGTVIGNVDLDGHLHLGATGVIQGDVTVSQAMLAGRVQGNIQCKGLLHLVSTAVVTGDITTDIIIVDSGAIFHGQCNTRNNEDL